jgi:cold-inducible RNA-binding protein
VKRLCVGNLSFGVTEEELRAEFENAGIKKESVTVVRDRDSGQPRGFGFVEISQDGDLEKDITALNGKNLSGRAIVVNKARPKGDGGGSRVGFGGGRGGRDGGGRSDW